MFRLQSLALAYSALGRNDEAKAALNELITKFRENPYEIAGVFAFRGDKDQAFKWLERAYVERDPGLIETKRDPLLKNIAADPRYTELLKKMRLPL
ncbi:MAG: hypothetical protein JO061_11505 [Acidobacteriaceae bacterium]|nr:hypothetical protein [Acidobacteriaceae bacterium]